MTDKSPHSRVPERTPGHRKFIPPEIAVRVDDPNRPPIPVAELELAQLGPAESAQDLPRRIDVYAISNGVVDLPVPMATGFAAAARLSNNQLYLELTPLLSELEVDNAHLEIEQVVVASANGAIVLAVENFELSQEYNLDIGPSTLLLNSNLYVWIVADGLSRVTVLRKPQNWS